MTNVKQTIGGHHKAVLKMNNPHNKTQLDNGCSCKSRDKCPLPVKCLTKSIVYQATASTKTTSQTKHTSASHQIHLKEDSRTIKRHLPR